MLQLKPLALLCSLSLLACCGTKEKKSQSTTLADCPVIAELVDSVTVLDLASVKDTFNIPMSLLLSSFEVVQLESSDEALVSHTNAHAITENYIGLYSYPSTYKLFDRKGKFLRDIAVKGQGPSDFHSAIYDSHIDEKNNRVYLISFNAYKILVFDLEGKAYPPIPLPFRVPKACFYIDAEKEELIITALPFKKVPYVVWKQDFKGDVLQSIDSKPFILEGNYGNEVDNARNTSAMDFQICTVGLGRNDPLYHYDEVKNKIAPVLTIKWDRDIAWHGHTELPNYYLTRLIIGATPTYSPRSPRILIEKETLRGCYANFKFNMLGNIDGPNYLTFNRGYFIGSMYPHEIKEQLENALAHPEKLTPQMKAKVKKLNDRITEDDNNIILLGKLRGSE